MPVRWIPYFRDEVYPVGEPEIEQLERDWGVRLPTQYKEIIRQSQGMSPEPGVYNIGKGRDVFSVLLTLSVKEGYTAYSIGRVYELLKQYVPPGIFPFGKTPGGEHLCFAYRDSPAEPRIVLVTVEMSIYPVADNFQEFLDGLYDGDERPR